jgi:hypothetical protein
MHRVAALAARCGAHDDDVDERESDDSSCDGLARLPSGHFEGTGNDVAYGTPTGTSIIAHSTVRLIARCRTSATVAKCMNGHSSQPAGNARPIFGRPAAIRFVPICSCTCDGDFDATAHFAEQPTGSRQATR